MTIPLISQELDELPDAPDPAVHGRGLFATVAAASVLAQKEAITQINAFRDEANAMATAMNDAAEDVESAIAAGATATAVTGTTKWIPGTTYAQGVCAWSPLDFQTYRRKITGAGTTDPSLDTTNWAVVRITGIGGSISAVATATASYTLTNEATILQVTPPNHGATVKLPNATTCKLGGPLHVVSNTSPIYHVRIADFSGKLLGYVYPGQSCSISLHSQATSAGVWALVGSERIGISAALEGGHIATFASNKTPSCIAELDGDIEIVLGKRYSDQYVVAVAFRKSTGGFGTPVVVRASNVECGILRYSSTAAVVAMPTSGNVFGACVVTVNPADLSLSVGGLATFTLPGAWRNNDPTAFLLAVPSLPNSFVMTYDTTSGNGAVAFTVSGTTIAFGTGQALTGGSMGVLALTEGDKLLVLSAQSSTSACVNVFTVSGSTLTPGTGATFATGFVAQPVKFVKLGTRWAALWLQTNTVHGSIISLSGTTVTMSWVGSVLSGTGSSVDAIVISSTKLLVVNNSTSNNANILRDNAGTAVIGTNITVTSHSSRCIVKASAGEKVVIASSTNGEIHLVDCSGTSPVVVNGSIGAGLSFAINAFGASDANLNKNAGHIYSPDGEFAMSLLSPALAQCVEKQTVSWRQFKEIGANQGAQSRGSSDAVRWHANSACMYKLECAA